MGQAKRVQILRYLFAFNTYWVAITTYNVPIYVFRQTEIYCPQLVTHFRANVRRILDYRLKFDYSEACLKMRLDLRDSFMWLSWNCYQISLMVQSRKTSFTICLNLRK